MEKAKNPRHKSPPGSRDRSVSMNHAAETPPAKKHRASDDEGDSAALIGSAPGSQDARLPPPTPTICVGQKATTTSPQNWKDATEDAAATASATAAMAAASMDHQAPRTTAATDAQVASSSPLSSTSSPAGSATSSPQATGSTTATAAAAATTTASTSGTTTPSGPNGDITEESFMAWLMEQKQQGVVASQMLDVLGLGVSEGTAIDDDELWDAILSMGMRLIQPSIPVRQKLEHVNTIQDVVALLQQAKKIVVLAGAGISVSCGIPDFRSENGIYSRLGEYNLPNPQCMFDIEFFRTNPRPFFAFAKELFPKANGFTFVPSRSHYFLKLLEEKGKLLRVYSQNIDMLEHAAGLSHERSILCHGSFATATCLACKRMFPGDAIRDDVMRQQVPMCKSCGAENGIVKPDIVFFGESLPRRFHDLIKADENEADLVLVMGSSLKVNPVRSLVGRIHNKAPMILINREPVGRPHKFDVELLGYSDEIVEELCRHLGWEIPKPDPVLLGQSNLTYNLDSLNKNKEPLPFEFFPPSRHMFNGSKSSSPSSSEVEDNDDSVDTSSSQDEDDGFSSSGRVRMSLDVGIDEPDFRAMNGVVVGDDDDQLMGSGSEMLRNSTFEEDGDL